MTRKKATITMTRTYTELVKIPDFMGRYEYLKLNGKIGEELFGYARYLNQVFYQSGRWKKVRRQVIIRDNGCDLGVEGHDIYGTIYVHHMNPINTKDIVNQTEYLMNPEYVISVRKKTHDAIHYGDETLIMEYMPIVRRPNDICPWKD